MKSLSAGPLAIVLGITVALAACGKKEEAPAPTVAPAPPPVTAEVAPPPAPESVRLVSLTLGNMADNDKLVASTETTFAPSDTIYAAVATNGAAPNAAIVVRWTFGDGQLVDESSQSIAPTGYAVTTFHIAKPDGWPPGNYKVEVSIDGDPVASKDFSIK